MVCTTHTVHLPLGALLIRCTVCGAGDNINGYSLDERKWNPQRLLDGYWHSAATLNYLRQQSAAPPAELLSGAPRHRRDGHRPAALLLYSVICILRTRPMRRS